VLSNDIVDRAAPSDGQATCEVLDCFRPKKKGPHWVTSRNFRSCNFLAYSGAFTLSPFIVSFLVVHVKTQAGQRHLNAWMVLSYLGQSSTDASRIVKV
jgi:hypothetical protein